MSERDLLLNSIKNKQLIGILNSNEYYQLLKIMCNEIISKARIAPNEATIENNFDTNIAILFNRLFEQLGLAYSPIKEDAVNTKRALSKGRADTSIGALIIEYKHHSKLKSTLDKESAIKQTSDYLDGFNLTDISKSIGFITDGLTGCFLIYDNGKIRKEAFEELNIRQLDRLIKYIIGLGQKAITSSNLVKDFCLSNHGEIPLSKRLSMELYNILLTNSSDKTKMLVDEWETLFKLSHDDQSQQVAIINRREALSEFFSDPLESSREQYLALFAIQTSYAILVKTIAFKVVSHIRYGRDLLNLEMISEYNSSALKTVFQNLEAGSIFRQYGIINLLEGDFFSWYSADNQWTGELYKILKEILHLLLKYSSIDIFDDQNKAQDFFKDLYITLMPDEVRHSLGEYYTKHWLAEKVIKDCLEEIDNKRWRGIDPCCGSGTFITIFIDMIKNDLAHEHDKRLILNEILTRVVGIDLNPVTVLTARVNYFMNIASLITDEKSIEIPIYLGDTALVPQKTKIDGVSCWNYKINTQIHPININIPCSATENLINFSNVMTEIEVDIKNLSERNIAQKILNLISSEEKTDKIISVINDFAEQLVYLERNGWNGIWSRIITNYLSTASIGKFDVVAGNPPWVDWKNLPSNYREKIKDICISRKLFSGDGLTGGINLNIVGREGVEVYPQELLIFTVEKNMPSTQDLITVINIQNPKSKFKVAQQMQFLEKKYLYPLVKGIDIKRFKLEKTDMVVPFPYDKDYSDRVALPIESIQMESPKLARFLLDNKSILQAQNKYSDKIINNQKSTFYSLARVGAYTFADYFVAYRDNSQWGACVVSKLETPWGELKRPVFQNHAPYISQDNEGYFITEDEAHYICAIINAPVTNDYIIQSSDSRSFPIRPRINIPKYAQSNKIHNNLSELSKKAHLLMETGNEVPIEIDNQLDNLYLELMEFINK